MNLDAKTKERLEKWADKIGKTYDELAKELEAIAAKITEPDESIKVKKARKHIYRQYHEAINSRSVPLRGYVLSDSGPQLTREARDTGNAPKIPGEKMDLGLNDRGLPINTWRRTYLVFNEDAEGTISSTPDTLWCRDEDVATDLPTGKMIEYKAITSSSSHSLNWAADTAGSIKTLDKEVDPSTFCKFPVIETASDLEGIFAETDDKTKYMSRVDKNGDEVIVCYDLFTLKGEIMNMRLEPKDGSETVWIVVNVDEEYDVFCFMTENQLQDKKVSKFAEVSVICKINHNKTQNTYSTNVQNLTVTGVPKYLAELEDKGDAKVEDTGIEDSAFDEFEGKEEDGFA